MSFGTTNFGPMGYGGQCPDDGWLTAGVMWRRCLAWLIDFCLIGLLSWVLWWILVMFGFLTFGLGFHAMGILPLVPFGYQFLSLLGSVSATPGQQIMGLIVRRNDDLGSPTGPQILVTILVLYVTIVTSGLLLLVACFTRRHRTLHDLVSGLAVVRIRALTAWDPSWNMQGGTSAL